MSSLVIATSLADSLLRHRLLRYTAMRHCIDDACSDRLNVSFIVAKILIPAVQCKTSALSASLNTQEVCTFDIYARRFPSFLLMQFTLICTASILSNPFHASDFIEMNQYT